MLVNSHQVLKICDFGSGKILNQQGLNTPYVVTQYYRAPELIMSHSDYTTAIDVWGIIT
jgi:serine/threonine protein kinase